MTDPQALSKTAAGMRLIAQTTLYNAHNAQRFETFIASSYHPSLLEQQDTPARLQAFESLYAMLGRWKIKQTLATNKHHVIVVFSTEHTPDFYYCELEVEEDYPHRIIAYQFAQMQEAEETSEG